MFSLKKDIYKSKLLIVKEGATVFKDQTKKENLKNIDVEESMPVMVVPTINPRYFRELVTKKKIPVYCIANRNGVDEKGNIGFDYHFIPNKACFIKFREYKFHGEYGISLLKANAEEIQNYILKHTYSNTDYKEFKKDLAETFKQGEVNYKNALMDASVSGKTKKI